MKIKKILRNLLSFPERPEETIAERLARISALIQNDDGQGLEEENRNCNNAEIYPNGSLPSTYSPLGEAIISAKVEAVRALLKHPRIDTRKTMPYLKSEQPKALMLAMIAPESIEATRIKFQEIFEILVQSPKININCANTLLGDSTLFIKSVLNPDLFYMQVLLKSPRLKINQTDVKRGTPLRWALWLNQPERIKLLLQHNDCEVEDRGTISELENSVLYRSPLAVAVGYNLAGSVALLLSAGANANGQAERLWGENGFYGVKIYELNFKQACVARDLTTLRQRLQIAKWLRGAGAKAEISAEVFATCQFRAGNDSKEMIELLATIFEGLKKNPLTMKELARQNIYRQLRRKTHVNLTILGNLEHLLDVTFLPTILQQYMRFEIIE